MTTKNPVHILDNTEHQDEAEVVAMTFEVAGPDLVIVTPRFNGYDHWEVPKRYTRAEARYIWADAVKANWVPRKARK